MQVVWAESPASARDVLERLEDETGWAYTTVKTIMSRLAEKGILSVRLRANTSLYEPLVDRDDAQRTAVEGLLERAFGGTLGPLVNFLVEDETLSKGDRKKLRAILEDESK